MDQAHAGKWRCKTMKKAIAVMIALMLMLTLGGCGKDEATSVENESGSVDTYEIENGETEAADSSEEISDDSEVISSEFKKTMDDYEAWFDHYCEVMKKYKKDSSNMELLSEMTDLLSEETTMLEQMENMDQSEMNNAELAYYLEVTARIEKKLLEVAY